LGGSNGHPLNFLDDRKRPRGRKRLGFLKEASSAELKRKAEHRKEWKTWKPRTCLTAEH